MILLLLLFKFIIIISKSSLLLLLLLSVAYSFVCNYIIANNNTVTNIMLFISL